MVSRYRVAPFALLGFLLLGLVLIGSVLAPRAAIAGPPPPELSDVPDVITITPDGSFPYLVTINGTNGPVVGAQVEVEFSVEATGLIAWTVPIPPGADIPITGPGGGLMYTHLTDDMGQAAFYIAGAGCVAQKNNAEPVDPYVAQVRADNFLMNECMANSPDAVDGDGELPEFLQYSICDQATGTTHVGLADALFHTPSVKQGLAEICSKFTEPFDDGVSLADAGVLTPYVKAGTSGSCVYNGP